MPHFMHKTIRLVMVSLCLFLASCQLTDYTVTKRSAIDKAIATARADTENKLKGLNQEEVNLLKQSISAHEAREQGAADYLFKGSVTFGTLKTPTRPEMVMGQSIQQTAIQLPPPSLTAQNKAYQDLKTELDETKISNETLKAQYEAELTKARADSAAKDKALTDIASALKHVDDEKIKVLTRAKDTEAELSDKRKELDNEALAKKDKTIADQAHNQKIKMWLIGILLTAAAACGVGAAFVPIPQLKTKLIIGAALCGGAAIAIPFIEPWMVMIAIGACLLGVGAWIVKDYHHEHSDAVDTYRAINEFKAKAKDTFDNELAPILDQWHTNPATTQRIDKVLKKVGDT